MRAAGVVFVSPRDGLLATVEAGLRPSGRDYSGSWIVFPESRPAHYLRKALAVREGRSFVPPRVDSLDGFIDRVRTERLGLGGRPIDVIDAAAVLLEIHRHAPDRLGRNRFLEADRFFPLGVKIYRDLEAIASSGAAADDIRKIENWADEAVPEKTRERLQRLSDFYEQFYAVLERRGLTTPASRLRDVAARLDPGLFPDVEAFVFAGFFALTKSEAGLLRTILEWPKARLLLLEGRGVESVLDRLAVDDPAVRAAAMAPAPRPGSIVEFVRSPDTHGQIFALNAALRKRLADPPRLDERVVIVLPAAETLFPLYLQTLSSLPEDRFNISLGYPLARTPVASFFERLLELVQSMDEEGKVFVPHYLRFVLHPYTKNLYFPGPERRSDLTRILFHAVEDELILRRSQGFRSLGEIETDEGTRKAVEERTAGLEGAPPPADFLAHLRAIHAATIAPFLDIRTVGDFAAKLIAVLDHIRARSTARLHPFFQPYAEAFRGRLEALERSLLREVSFRDKAGYVNLFRKVAAEGAVPFPGTPLQGLQVLGFWETRGLPFEEVHLLDMNEDVLPATRRADSILPLGARQALGLPTFRDLERAMEYQLDVLVRGARTVRVFFVENNDRERSRFVERLLWDRQKREGAAEGASLVRAVEYRVALHTAEPGAVEKTAETVEFLRGFRYSATALDAYLACPLRFHHAYVLGLKEKEEAADAMKKKDLGTYVHAVLESYFQRFIGRPLRPEELRPEDIETEVEAVFERHFGRDVRGPAYLMKTQTKRHLAEFLSFYQAPLVRKLRADGQDLVVLGLEHKETVAREVEPRPGPGSAPLVFTLSVRVDRMETRGGRLHVLDYKTSSDEKSFGVKWGRLDPGVRGAWGRAVGSLQIPLYTHVLAARRGLDPGAVHGAFLMLGKNRLGPGIEYSPYDAGVRGQPVSPEERRSRIGILSRILDDLLREIVDPEIPFRPAPESEKACRFCPYTGLCGRSAG